jgi:hypothetical protein
MIEENSARRSAVQALLEMSEPLDSVFQRLQHFGWDYEGVPVLLERKHLVRALQKYLGGELMAADIEKWANGIEGREDIDFEEQYEGVIDETLYELANPLLTMQLEKLRAQALIVELSSLV